MTNKFYEDPKRYVQVRDLPIGTSEAYTDYEELAFNDLDAPWIDKLRQQIASIRPGEVTQAMIDQCDVIFYSAIHVLTYWADDTGKVPSDNVIRQVVDVGQHVLETLQVQQVCRSDTNWQELINKHTASINNSHV